MTRRLLMALIGIAPAVSAIPADAKSSPFRGSAELSEFERTHRLALNGLTPREFFPDGGDLGRGKVLPYLRVLELEKLLPTLGFDAYSAPTTNVVDFPIFAYSGAPSTFIWRGWIRRSAGKNEIIAVEYNGAERYQRL